MTYHQFTNESGEQYGSFETFYLNPAQAWEILGDSWELSDQGEHITLEGVYWQACFPGCLPCGEPIGPFGTEQDAIKDATEYC